MGNFVDKFLKLQRFYHRMYVYYNICVTSYVEYENSLRRFLIDKECLRRLNR